MFFSNITRGVVLVIAFMLTLGGCGGGSKAPFSVSPTSLSFTGTTTGDVITPPSQTLAATPNQGGMSLLIIFPSIVDIAATNLYSCGSALCADVVPVLPSSIGVGNYSDIIEFTACTDLSSPPTSCYNTQIHQINVPMSYAVTVSFSLTPSDTQTPTSRVNAGYTGYVVEFDNNNEPKAIRKIDVPDDTVPHLLSR